MFKGLMTSRRFAPLFWCQLCSALNDNFLKNALVMLVLYGLGGAGSGLGAYGEVLVPLAGIVFIAPFFILSALGGELADRYDKGATASVIKLAEIPVAGLAAAGFVLHSIPLLFVALGLFGVLAALFGPVKYGILPEKLSTAELAPGNALVEGATFLAILAGTIAGGVAVQSARTPELIVAVVVALAVASWLFARAIPVTGPAAPKLTVTANPWTSTLALLRELKAEPRMWSGGHIVSWFWLVGSVALALLPPMVKSYIGGSEDVVTLCLATFVAGIAFGSALAARASHGSPNLALVPLGAALMGLFSLAVALLAGLLTPGPATVGAAAVLATANGLALLAALGGLAVAGGLYIVPAFAAVQAWSPPEARARVIASVNVLNAAYMVTGGAVVAGLLALGVGVPALFGALGILSLTAATPYVLRAWRPYGVRGPAVKA
jgi:acyl-[acyl-carrier-protein]-phospholipid O-acyltransferase/long-chain-fatty-acid--[acyl-carrier-protein] ligase